MSGWRLRCEVCGEILTRWPYRPPPRIVSAAREEHRCHVERHSRLRRVWARIWPPL